MKKRKVGILILHGVGEQDKYDKLDLFTRNLLETVQESTQGRIHVTHTLMEMGGELDDLIRITDEGDGLSEIDIHEYYWARSMERLISFGETVHWMNKVLETAQRYAKRNEEFASRYEPFDENGKFRWRWFLRDFGWAISFLFLFVRVTGIVLPGYLDPFIRACMSKPIKIFTDYVGDVTIYTTSNMRGKYFNIRERMLRGAVHKITNLMKADYDRIVIAAHSLGSVIAYDALNRINLKMHIDDELAANRGKLSELITFGSPLDKIAFFFREQADEEEYVKRLVINHLKSFRWREQATYSTDKLVVESTVKNHLEHVNWYNYWDKQDPISGHLDFYSGVHNIEIDTGLRWGYSHIGYWEHKQIYRDAVQRGLQEKARLESDISGTLDELQATLQSPPRQTKQKPSPNRA